MAITAIRELKVLQKLKHKNIVALKEVVTEGTCVRLLSIVLPLAPPSPLSQT